MVSPALMREKIVQKFYDGHFGVTKCLERVNSPVWPGIIKRAPRLGFCQVNRPLQRREPFIPSPLPERPWQKVGVNAFELDGKKYVVLVEHITRGILILLMYQT